MSLADRLMELAKHMPPGSSVTFTAESLLALLEGSPERPAPETTGDLSVAQIAAQLQRAPSTVRGWLEAGRFAGAYKLNDRDWRIPPDAFAAFYAAQRGAGTPQPVDLSGWRRMRRRAG
jgi:Helix-turn-helix domain